MFKEVIALGESMSAEIRNVIIIGSGPAGYTAGLYTSRAMLEPLMFAGYMSGGQLMLTSDIENFPGYPEGIGGPETSTHDGQYSCSGYRSHFCEKWKQTGK